MKYFTTEFDERSGLNYHEAEYSFHLDFRALFSHVNMEQFSEEYHSSCQTSPFKLKFCMTIAKGSYGTFVCIIHMKRIDKLPALVTVRFTLGFEFPGAPVFHFPETEIACGQEIMKMFNPFLDLTTLYRRVCQPLDILLRFTFFNCHKNKRERDVSKTSDDPRRSTKKCKI